MSSVNREQSASSGAMDDFLKSLDSRGKEPLLNHIDATVQIDLIDPKGEEQIRFVSIHDGDVDLVKESRRADAVVRAERSVLDSMAEGRTNPMAAMLRGVLTIDGDLEVIASFFRVLPGPPQAGRSVPGKEAD